MQSVTWGNSAYTSDSGSCDPTLLVSVVGVTDRARLSLGFEPCDARLYCLGPSLGPSWPGHTGRPTLRQIVGVCTVPPCLVMSRLHIRLQAGRWPGRQVIAGLSASAEGQRLPRIGRTAKDPVQLRRAIVVLMPAQGQSAPDIAHLLAVARAVSTD